MPVLATPYGHTLSYFFLSLTKFQFLSLRAASTFPLFFTLL